jgi:hypothetical protein
MIKFALVCVLCVALFGAWMHAVASRTRALEDLRRMTSLRVECSMTCDECEKNLQSCGMYYDMCMNLSELPFLERRPW